MFKRMLSIGALCIVALSIASIALAQQTPTPVVRMGDWVEIGNDAFINITGNIDARYTTTHNFDFEDDIQDRVNSRNPTSSTVFAGAGDHFQAEIRWGADFRYKKNLNTRILFETQSIFDGNLIDDNSNTTIAGDADRGIGSLAGEQDNSPHVERFWIDYRWNDLIRTRIGADLWKVDQFGLLGDDDPAFAVFITPSPDLEFHVRAVIQTESTRLGLTNDNDDVYYTFGARYTGMKGHTFQLDAAYFRFRFSPRFDADTFMIIPNYEGNLGIVRLTALFAAVFGEVDGAAGENYDVAGFAFIAHAVANLGKFRPFVGVVFGSADDDAGDNDLNGFHHLPRQSISLGSGDFEWGLTSPSQSEWGPSAGANAGFGGGVPGASTTGNMFLDRLGNTAHPGTSVAYSNAGTLRFGVGAHFLPWKGHRLAGYYQYVGFLDDATLQATAPAGFQDRSYDKTLFHELSAVWSWTVNRHFDVRALVNVHLPGGGTEDMAATVTCSNNNPCEGEDIAVRGTLRFRAMF